MDIDKIKNEIVESVKSFFKSEFETKVDEALKKGEKIKTNFMLEDGDLETINSMIAEAMQPLLEEIATLKGGGEEAASEAEAMKKELEEVKAAKQELEVKLAAEPEVPATKVIPSGEKKMKIELTADASRLTKLEAFYAQRLIK